MNNPIWSMFLVFSLTLLSGFADAQGFIYAGKIWQNRQFVLNEAIKSAIGFVSGFLAYWFALCYMTDIGLATAEMQTLFWFTVTSVGVALLSGKFATWSPLEQTVAIAILAGIGWLLVRTGS